MSASASVLIITGNEPRHKYYVQQLSKHVEVKAVIFEKKANVHEQFELVEKEADILKQHFASRAASEKKYFGEGNFIPDCPYKELATGKVNEAETINWIASFKFDYVLLFGSSLVKDTLLDLYPNRFINLHLGLSPYYRGSGTNFWPLVHDKPECVGATIHIATNKVDAGAILHQVRPGYEATDTVHDLGHKTILNAVDALPFVVNSFKRGLIAAQPQDLSNGLTCKRKDLNADDINILYQNFENGMMARFLENKQQRLDKYPIVNGLMSL